MYAAGMALFRKKTSSQSEIVLGSDPPDGQVFQFTAIPEDCLPGGPDEETYKDAYENLLTASSEQEKQIAWVAMRGLGITNQEFIP